MIGYNMNIKLIHVPFLYLGYSILCLQDTHFIPDIEPLIETQWGYKCIFNSFESNSRGVSIFLITILSLKYTMK